MTRIWVERSAGHSFAGDRHFEGTAHSFVDCSELPAPTITAQRPVHLVIEYDGREVMQDSNKPDYRVPTMAELREMPWNGFNVVSTFAGCGGSSTGYRMAGFRILLACEFVEAAREAYAANMREGTQLEGRDIRAVSGQDILDRINLKVGELDVLDGSPPCASFSTAGKREKGWGTVKKYSDTEQRADDLFFEFARLVGEIKPKVFVAENVSGLVKGTAKGYFLEILAALKAEGYRVSAKLLDAQWLGVPQARQRLIFVGVRDDLGLDPAHPKPLPYRYSIRDALPWISKVSSNSSYVQTWHDADRPSPTVTATIPTKSLDVEAESDISKYAIGAEWDKIGVGGQSEKYFQLVRPNPEGPAPTITASGGAPSIASVTHPTEKRKFSIAELRRICGFPDDFILTGSYQQQWERLGRAVPPVMMSHIAATVRDEILCRSSAKS